MYEEIGDILQSGETEDLDKAYRLALRSRKPNIPKNSFKQNVDFEDEQQPIVYNREIDNKKQYLRRLKDELERQYQNS
jgi:hypothetical protein